jgi:hypothetical protein
MGVGGQGHVPGTDIFPVPIAGWPDVAQPDENYQIPQSVPQCGWSVTRFTLHGPAFAPRRVHVNRMTLRKASPCVGCMISPPMPNSFSCHQGGQTVSSIAHDPLPPLIQRHKVSFCRSVRQSVINNGTATARTLHQRVRTKLMFRQDPRYTGRWLERLSSDRMRHHVVSQKSMSHLKCLGVRHVTWRMFHTEDPKILSVTIQASIATATWRAEFMRPLCMGFTTVQESQQYNIRCMRYSHLTFMYFLQYHPV